MGRKMEAWRDQGSEMGRRDGTASQPRHCHATVCLEGRPVPRLHVMQAKAGGVKAK